MITLAKNNIQRPQDLVGKKVAMAVEAIRAGFSACFPNPLDATSFVRELENVIND